MSEAENTDLHVPSEIRLDKSKELLRVSFLSGEEFEYSAEFLRVFSPSAEVQGHSEAERKLQWGKSGVIIIGVKPVGNYAVRIEFSDGHRTGLYSWTYLHHLGVEHDSLWASYLQELEQAGKSR